MYARLAKSTTTFSIVGMISAVVEKSDRFDLSAAKEQQQGLKSEEHPSIPPQQCQWERGIKKIHNIIRVIAVISSIGYLLYSHSDNYLSKRISQGVTSLREWRHHPYTLPELYSLCTREGRGIYTSDFEAEWAQCVTVQQGKIVDVGDFGRSHISINHLHACAHADFTLSQLKYCQKRGTYTESITKRFQG